MCNNSNRPRIHCRLGAALNRQPDRASEAVSLLEAAGIPVYRGADANIRWWCGFEREYGGLGQDGVNALRMRYPDLDVGIWPMGIPELATAVAVESLLDGADAVMCAGPGLDEGAPLATVVAAMALYGMPGVDAPAVMAALRTIHAHAGWDIPAHQPVLGERIFHVGTGIHVDGLIKDTRTYEPWDPAWLGQRRVFVAGAHSGRAVDKLRKEDARCLFS